MPQTRDGKSVRVLSQVAATDAALDDKATALQVVRSSPDAHPFDEAAKMAVAEARACATRLWRWFECQRAWVELEQVFAATDMKRTSPAAHTDFAKYDAMWRALMARLSLFLHATACLTVPGLDDTLDELEVMGKRVQRELADYLALKREACPRLYFLSDGQLLDLLRDSTGGVQAVQGYMPLVFNVQGVQCTKLGLVRRVRRDTHAPDAATVAAVAKMAPNIDAAVAADRARDRCVPRLCWWVCL